MIRQIKYNELVCDACGFAIKIWEGHPAFNYWLRRNEYNGKDGYRDVDYCTECRRIAEQEQH